MGSQPTRVILEAARAADLMTPDPVSIGANATVLEVVAMLTQRGASAAPVIDEAGRPVGVVSRADLLIHQRELLAGGKPLATDPTRVRDLMTPAVFSVAPETPAHKVIEQMLTLNVHQLYVVDGDQLLVGVITPLDILRRLRSA